MLMYIQQMNVEQKMDSTHENDVNVLIEYMMRISNSVLNEIFSYVDRNALINFVLINKTVYQHLSNDLQLCLNKKWMNSISTFIPEYATDVKIFVCFRSPFDHPMSPCRVANTLLDIKPFRLTIVSIPLESLVDYKHLYSIDIIEQLIANKQKRENSKGCKRIFFNMLKSELAASNKNQSINDIIYYKTSKCDNDTETKIPDCEKYNHNMNGYDDENSDEIPIRILTKLALFQKQAMIEQSSQKDIVSPQETIESKQSRVLVPNVNHSDKDEYENFDDELESDTNRSETLTFAHLTNNVINNVSGTTLNNNGGNFDSNNENMSDGKHDDEFNIIANEDKLNDRSNFRAQFLEKVKEQFSKYNDLIDAYCYLNMHATFPKVPNIWLKVSPSVVHFEMINMRNAHTAHNAHNTHNAHNAWNVNEFNRSTLENALVFHKASFIRRIIRRNKYSDVGNPKNLHVFMNICFRNMYFVPGGTLPHVEISTLSLINCENISHTRFHSISNHRGTYKTIRRTSNVCDIIGACVIYEQKYPDQRRPLMVSWKEYTNADSSAREIYAKNALFLHNNDIKIEDDICSRLRIWFNEEKQVPWHSMHSDLKQPRSSIMTNTLSENFKKYYMLSFEYMFLHFRPRTIILNAIPSPRKLNKYPIDISSLYDSLYSNNCVFSDNSSKHINDELSLILTRTRAFMRNRLTKLSINTYFIPDHWERQVTIFSRDTWSQFLELAIQLPNLTHIETSDVVLSQFSRSMKHQEARGESSSEIQGESNEYLLNNMKHDHHKRRDVHCILSTKIVEDDSFHQGLNNGSSHQGLNNGSSHQGLEDDSFHQELKEDREREIILLMTRPCVLVFEQDYSFKCLDISREFVIPCIIPNTIQDKLISIKLLTNVRKNRYLINQSEHNELNETKNSEHNNMKLPIYFTNDKTKYEISQVLLRREEISQVSLRREEFEEGEQTKSVLHLFWIITFMRTISNKYQHIILCQSINNIVNEIDEIYSVIQSDSKLLDGGNSNTLENKDDELLEYNNSELKIVMNDGRMCNMQNVYIKNKSDNNSLIALIDLIRDDSKKIIDDLTILCQKVNIIEKIDCVVIFVRGELSLDCIQTDVIDLLLTIIDNLDNLKVLRIVSVFSKKKVGRKYTNIKKKFKNTTKTLTTKCPQNDTFNVLYPMLGSHNFVNKMVRQLINSKRKNHFYLTIASRQISSIEESSSS